MNLGARRDIVTHVRMEFFIRHKLCSRHLLLRAEKHADRSLGRTKARRLDVEERGRNNSVLQCTFLPQFRAICQLGDHRH
jgi:hypothetical protein